MPIVNDLPKQSAPYVQLNWIQGQGNQWIDAGFVPTGDTTEFECKWNNMRLSSADATPMTIFGTRSDYNRYQYQLTDFCNGAVTGYFGMSGGSLLQYDMHYPGNSDILTTFRNRVLTTGTGYTYTIPTGAWNTARKLVIFALSDSSFNISEMATFKLYYLKIWYRGLLIRDFIPVRKLSNGEVCLYDKANQIFFTNQGSGSFIGG